jgi:hypothetical protein
MLTVVVQDQSVAYSSPIVKTSTILLVKTFKKFEKLIGTGTISGHNPLDYYDADEED